MTAVPSLERDKAVLSRLADIAERMQGDSWAMIADGDGLRVTSRRAEGEEVAICVITPSASPDEIDLIAGALDDLLCFVRSRNRAVAEFRELRRRHGREEHELRDGDFAANAAMLCSERPFQRFLEERAAGPIRDKEAADSALKKLLAITSKTHLNDDPDAQARWISLRADYQFWMRS